ncbi:MAG TPA: SRPBCC domain-containing protein [Rhizomicrobium sp.]|jgi:uncharacterized protein YndB with AHSA1/START domain
MKSSVLSATVALALTASGAIASPIAIRDESYRDGDGHRVLSESVIVEGPSQSVWNAFTTDQGFMRWAVPVAHITPGNGGMMESALTPTGKIGEADNVRNRILVYLPRQMLVLASEHVPSGGPIDGDTFRALRTIIAFKDLGPEQTQVTESVVGFGDSKAFDEMYAHLRGGNAEYLERLAQSFARPATN